MGVPNEELIRDLIRYYKDPTGPFTLKAKILNLFKVLICEEYKELHFYLADLDFYRRIKEDMLFDLEKTLQGPGERNYFFKYFEAAVEFFEELFYFNTYESNVGICEDLEFEYFFIDAFVRNASVPQVPTDHPGRHQAFRATVFGVSLHKHQHCLLRARQQKPVPRA